ncbi:MAG TPA: hypothetical protein VN326_09535 [Casimicrobiaceae bacterium]|jgi:hypothetical protein|nr:hypothetical protein [Casimicrobiaceae bacterium]
MASLSSSNTIDLQKLITGAAKLELKALHAAVECVQVWVHQAAKLSNIAGDTLQAVQDDKGSLSDTVRRLTEFGKQNADVFGDLSSRLSKSYYEEVGRLVAAISSKASKAAAARKPARQSAAAHKPARQSAPAHKPARRKPARRKKARSKA